MFPFFDGIVARAQHNAAGARSSFQLLRDRVAIKLRQCPDDAQLTSDLSVADAGLGLKENALRVARSEASYRVVSRFAGRCRRTRLPNNASAGLCVDG